MAFETFLNSIEEVDKRAQVKEILDYIHEKFPQLDREIKWKQPFFLNEGTFILALSVAKGHISIAPEEAAIEQFKERIAEAGYAKTKGLFKIKFTDKVDFLLIKDMVQFNIKDKQGYSKLWR